MTKFNGNLTKAVADTVKYNPVHLDSLFNRERGSQFGRPLKIEDLVSMKWKQLPRYEYKKEHLDGKEGRPMCYYYYLDAEGVAEMFPEALECVASSADLDPSDIQSMTAQHLEGTNTRTRELVSDKVLPSIPKEACLIVGDASTVDNEMVPGAVMVWTVYPGRTFPPLPEDWDGKVESLDLSIGYAVKGMAAITGG
tara:strand:+ start:429 stop:1016 length:588 start_codon:yes stop_codon:yes gene_type:complete